MAPLTVIVNPASGGGRSRDLRAQLSAAFDGLGAEYVTTHRVGEEEELARKAVEGGAETIVAVGGDGTWGNVAHAIVTSGRQVKLALIAAGTGNDFAKSVAAPASDPGATAALIKAGAERCVDVGLADDRVFLNCCGTGFDAAVLARSDRMRIVRGSVRYLAAALAELRSYRGDAVRITPWPDHETADTLLTVFANGAWYGGMFHIAPNASPSDGRLEAIRIADVRGLKRLLLLASAIRGGHMAHPEVRTSSGESFTLQFPAPPVVNTDGELRRAKTTELRISVLPGALRLVAPTDS